MATTTLSEMWKLVLDDLQVDISAASFTSWVAPLTAEEWNQEEGALEVGCPSSFHVQIVERRYKKQMEEAVQRVFKHSTQIWLKVRDHGPTTTVSAGPLFEQVETRMDPYHFALQRVGLREDFSFDTFAVSSSNEMAHAAAVAVADSFGTAYNPLFIYGGVGVGKTHLSHAVALKYLYDNPEATMIYCMSEEFTNGIIEAIQQKKTHEFRRRYRQVKGLFIDDIQFIAGKTTVQEEFFHTFNAILKAGGQVVMTSDRPPGDIPHLEARLRSRFEAGLLVDIGNPDFELKTAITLIKAEQRDIPLTMELAQIVAANIDSARQIEGFLTRLLTETRLRKKDLNEALVKTLLGSSSLSKERGAPAAVRPLEVLQAVSRHFSISTKQLRGTRRQKHLVAARHIAMYILRVDYHLALTEIGALFSGRDHTTIIHAVDKISGQLKDMESLRGEVGRIRDGLFT